MSPADGLLTDLYIVHGHRLPGRAGLNPDTPLHNGQEQLSLKELITEIHSALPTAVLAVWAALMPREPVRGPLGPGDGRMVGRIASARRW